MSRISIAFFGTAVLYALAGMVLGMVMAASNDHLLTPVHAHMNLLGWASLAVMGAFYGIAGDRAPARLAWANFTISNLGNLVTLPLLAMLLKGDAAVIPVMVVGEVLIVAGMLTFGAAVLTVGRTPAAAA
ncbi:hypothetical protein DJ021_06070 [Phenylobacterium hankyongense]|uniref:Cytochrome-c oxidase n=1 Tax=Phenylobacterium hankyongense TaxID=1813876 RepID=A0A328AW91_9CAUL|nr:hypothetical protein [Phenylobacterium hankyongense]RAK59402.1 hypothetical protein DJ021_06070 [Phenylobacterium hankyongense]